MHCARCSEAHQRNAERGEKIVEASCGCASLEKKTGKTLGTSAARQVPLLLNCFRTRDETRKRKILLLGRISRYMCRICKSERAQCGVPGACSQGSKLIAVLAEHCLAARFRRVSHTILNDIVARIMVNPWYLRLLTLSCSEPAM